MQKTIERRALLQLTRGALLPPEAALQHHNVKFKLIQFLSGFQTEVRAHCASVGIASTGPSVNIFIFGSNFLHGVGN
jgi:hypothetical protein